MGSEGLEMLAIRLGAAQASTYLVRGWGAGRGHPPSNQRERNAQRIMLLLGLQVATRD